MFPHLAVIACWLVFWLYWRFSAQSVKPTEQTKIRFSGMWPFIGRVFMFFLLAETFGYFPVPLLHDSLFPKPPVVADIGAVCALVGLGAAITARRALSSNWSSNIDIKHEHELITSGLYALIRHPIYTGIILLALGTFLESARISALIFLVLLVAFLLFKLRAEEAFLMEQFPEQYPRYRERTKALIPYIW